MFDYHNVHGVMGLHQKKSYSDLVQSLCQQTHALTIEHPPVDTTYGL
jgi:hypothetical protein